MNRPPEEFRCIAEKDLLIFATACLQHAGMPGDQASLLARCLVNSDLRGVRSHGTRALGGYCGALRERSRQRRPGYSRPQGDGRRDPRRRRRRARVLPDDDGYRRRGPEGPRQGGRGRSRLQHRPLRLRRALRPPRHGGGLHRLLRAGVLPSVLRVERGKAGDVLRQPAAQLRPAQRFGAPRRPRLRHLHHGRRLARTAVRGPGNPHPGGFLQVDGVHRGRFRPRRGIRRPRRTKPAGRRSGCTRPPGSGAWSG